MGLSPGAIAIQWHVEAKPSFSLQNLLADEAATYLLKLEYVTVKATNLSYRKVNPRYDR